MPAWRSVAVCSLLAGLCACSTVQPRRTAAEFEAETKADNRAWQATRTVLEAFGFEERTATLDSMWKQTHTPEQWEALKNAVPQTDPRHLRIAKLCAGAAGNGFSRVFQVACQNAEDPSALFSGLFLWATTGGKPRFQGRQDLALHFICGGLTEALFHNGVELAIIKERRDHAAGKPFDLDDLAATLAGALWIEQQKHDPQWLGSWAGGTRSIERTIHPLRHGTTRPTDMERIEEVFRKISDDYGMVPPPGESRAP